MNQQRALLVDVYSRPASWQRAATRIDGHALALIVGLLVLLASAGLLYLLQASAATELRFMLQERRAQEQALQEQIIHLRCQIALGQSISSLEPRAERLGLVDASPGDPLVLCYVPVPTPIPAQAERMRAPVELDRTLQELWRWLRARLQPAERLE